MECLLCIISSWGQRLPKTSLSLLRKLQGTFPAHTQCCLFYVHVSPASHTGQNLGPQQVPEKGENSWAEPVPFGGFPVGSCSSCIYYRTSKRKTVPSTPTCPRKTNLFLALAEGKTKLVQVNSIRNIARWCVKVFLWLRGENLCPRGSWKTAPPPPGVSVHGIFITI